MTEQNIFLAALDVADLAERSAYLNRACAGDAQLRQQVDALLAAHGRSRGVSRAACLRADGSIRF